MKNLILTFSFFILASVAGFANPLVNIGSVNKHLSSSKSMTFKILKANEATSKLKTKFSINFRTDKNTKLNKRANVNSLFSACSNEPYRDENGQMYGYARTCCVYSLCTTIEVFFQY